MIVLGPDLEVGLGMLADGADIRGCRADNNMSAVAALPDGDAALGKDLQGFHVVQELAAALLMHLLNGGHAPELLGQLMEALLSVLVPA